MPRGEYARFFKHDAQGHYVGTEPEREWAEDEIMDKYGAYQALPLRSAVVGDGGGGGGGRGAAGAAPDDIVPTAWGAPGGRFW